VFTALNEAGVDMKWGLVSLNGYFLCALGFLTAMRRSGSRHPTSLDQLGDAETVEFLDAEELELPIHPAAGAII
jgi:hypothetical protein